MSWRSSGVLLGRVDGQIRCCIGFSGMKYWVVRVYFRDRFVAFSRKMMDWLRDLKFRASRIALRSLPTRIGQQVKDI